MAWHGLGNVNSLLQQMQDIEVSLSNLMMETILKMQTLMSTKVFLVLEDPTTNSRRYCGNKELIAAYERSNFKATASSANGDGGEKEQDLEVRLDPNVDLLTTRPVGRKRRANAGGDGDGRMAAIDDNRTPSPPKRITRGSEEGDESLLDEEGDGDEEGYTVKVKNEVYTEDDEYAHVPFTSGGITMEAVNDDVDDNDDEMTNRDNDDDCVLGEFGGKTAGGSNKYRGAAKNGGLSEMSSVEKIKMLRELPDALSAFRKGSWENKLLSNVMYQFGKQLGMKCPYHDAGQVNLVRQYLKSHMHRFVQNFPHILQLKKKDLPVWSLAKAQGPICFMKSMIRGGFKTYAPQFFKMDGVYRAKNEYNKNYRKKSKPADEANNDD